MLLRGNAITLFFVFLLSGSVHADALGPSKRTVEFRYQFTVRDIPVQANQVYAWVPLPLSGPAQTLRDYRIEGDWKFSEIREEEYGNRFLRFDLSEFRQSVATIIITYRLERRAWRPLEQRQQAGAPSSTVLTRYLQPDRMIPIDGRIAAEAKQVTLDAAGPLEQARQLYEHVTQSIEYDKSGSGWGLGDALYACDIRSGNCTDFHSLFIGEARALGIPARFIMGAPLPIDRAEGSITGYHCWAEFYVADKGWLPVDASEAHQHPDLKETFFGGLDANRIAFTIGRDIHLPGAVGDVLNYAFYPYVEIDGQPHPGAETALSFRNE